MTTWSPDITWLPETEEVNHGIVLSSPLQLLEAPPTPWYCSLRMSVGPSKLFRAAITPTSLPVAVCLAPTGPLLQLVHYTVMADV